MSSDILLRDFASSDIPAMTKIYAHYVAHSTVTFDTETPKESDLVAKFSEMVALGHPVIIAEQNGEIVGYAYASFFRPREAYRFTCEDTIYLHPDALGQGLGARLLERLIRDAKAFGFRQMIGIIEASAAPSIRVHEKFGFEILGRFPQLGYKFDRWQDIVHMQRAL